MEDIEEFDIRIDDVIKNALDSHIDKSSMIIALQKKIKILTYMNQTGW